jgi:hypothetical protein
MGLLDPIPDRLCHYGSTGPNSRQALSLWVYWTQFQTSSVTMGLLDPIPDRLCHYGSPGPNSRQALSLWVYWTQFQTGFVTMGLLDPIPDRLCSMGLLDPFQESYNLTKAKKCLYKNNRYFGPTYKCTVLEGSKGYTRSTVGLLDTFRTASLSLRVYNSQ